MRYQEPRLPSSDLVESVIIEGVYPELDGGRHPIKREVGDTFEVWADIFAEGHDVLGAVLRYRTARQTEWQETRMALVDNDRWRGSFTLEQIGRYLYAIVGYRDVFETWRMNLSKKAETGEDLSSELLEGQRMIAAAAQQAAGADRYALEEHLGQLRSAADQPTAVSLALHQDLAELMERYGQRHGTTTYRKTLEVVVDPVSARFAAWYELFPRSQSGVPGRHGTFRDVERRLPAIQAMGFDVLYLTPIHPIGQSYRKGRNNTLSAGPNDPGSPWAIGNESGGHTSIHPDLGTIDDFDHLVDAARSHGLEIALDIAIQCSPDHPYANERPEWFYHRPDGTIRYAENPPKKYQDIYPVNFHSENWRDLWAEMKSIFSYWIQHGVRMFRVDNPHTKPFNFWEWCIGEIKAEHPDVIFLAEAFTRPKVMKYLAKAGFSQSYTYFTWRNFKHELTEYFTELTQTEVAEYLRGNLFTNTPDILPPFLQEGGRPAFKIRLVLAGTLSSLYGIYSGFELCDNEAVPGTEEYLNSEKYEIRAWDWDQPGNIAEYIARVNRIRRENPSLHLYRNVRFFQADDDNVLFYGKASPDASKVVLIAVNLDPFQAHETVLHIPLHELGIAEDQTFEAHELITDKKYLWRGGAHTLRLDPEEEPAAIFSMLRWPHKDFGTPCL